MPFDQCFDIAPKKSLFLSTNDKDFYHQQISWRSGYNYLKPVSLHPSKISKASFSFNNDNLSTCSDIDGSVYESETETKRKKYFKADITNAIPQQAKWKKNSVKWKGLQSFYSDIVSNIESNW